MDAGEVNINERISMTRTTYSALKEDMKDDECGWSEALFNGSTYFAQSSLPI
jgi:hypothetical protein